MAKVPSCSNLLDELEGINVDTEMIAIKAQEIADAVKSGSFSPFSDELNSMNEAERVAICRRADEINHRMRTANSSLPDLQLDIGCVNGILVLKDVRAVKSDGQSLDLYDRPADCASKQSAINDPGLLRRIEPAATSTVLPTPLPPVADSLRRAAPSDRSESDRTTTPAPGARIEVEPVVGASSSATGMLRSVLPPVAETSRRAAPSDRSESAGTATPVPGAQIPAERVVGASRTATGRDEKH